MCESGLRPSEKRRARFVGSVGADHPVRCRRAPSLPLFSCQQRIRIWRDVSPILGVFIKVAFVGGDNFIKEDWLRRSENALLSEAQVSQNSSGVVCTVFIGYCAYPWDKTK